MTETQHTPDEVKKKVFEMIRDIKVALMATQDGNGLAHARPMVAVAPKEEFNGTLWFFTRDHSRKVEEIERSQGVLLSYSEPSDQNYVSLTGKAKIVRDQAIVDQLWTEGMRTWFPNGPKDPEIALIKVTAEEAEYWDSPSSVLVYAYGYAKARLTGESPNPGDAGKVEFADAS